MHRTAPFLCVLLATALAPAAAQQAPAPAAAAHDSLVAAVQKVDVRTRTIEVTGGVGLALRVVRLQVPADTRITAKGAALRFELLMPGDVLRVSFGARQTGNVAYTIERLGNMATGREQTP